MQAEGGEGTVRVEVGGEGLGWERRERGKGEGVSGERCAELVMRGESEEKEPRTEGGLGDSLLVRSLGNRAQSLSPARQL